MTKRYLLSLLLCLSKVRAEQRSVDNARTPRCAAEQFQLHDVVPGVKIISVEAQQRDNYTIHGARGYPLLENLGFCQVKVLLTHGDDHATTFSQQNNKDTVLVEAWLPLTRDDWNGRFQAVGGGGFATGMFDTQLASAIKDGYAAVSTDGGHEKSLAKARDASWALKSDKTINWTLMRNFAIRSLVEQIPIGKSITTQYFGTAPHHSYWNGCSTGGRQGYAIAQRFPGLIDGILAEAPAISFTQLVIAEYWPQLKMIMSETYPTNCELEYYRAKAIESCDGLDGVFDGILENPEDCKFDPHELVKEKHTFECDGTKVEFTTEMAQLISAIHAGPGISQSTPLFPGFALGVPLDPVTNITVSEHGIRSARPFPLSASFLRNLVLKDPTFDLTTLDLPAYLELFGRASHELGGLMNADNPDLSLLQSSGTKMLSWHGLNDDFIPYQNTVEYREKVEAMMGGPHEVDEYYRLFLAPGVNHCAGGTGALPKNPLSVLVDWVENGNAPETIPAEIIDSDGELVTRDLCAWPGKSKYMGIGDARRASSWTCEGGTERPIVEDNLYSTGSSRAQQVIEDLADRLNVLGLGLSIG